MKIIDSKWKKKVFSDEITLFIYVFNEVYCANLNDNESFFSIRNYKNELNQAHFAQMKVDN
jgi:hypothetical protein